MLRERAELLPICYANDDEGFYSQEYFRVLEFISNYIEPILISTDAFRECLENRAVVYVIHTHGHCVYEHLASRLNWPAFYCCCC